MKVLCHQLILVAVLITGRAGALSERTRRDEEQVPLSGQIKAYPESSLNLNTEAQLSAETGEGTHSVGKDLNLKTPNGFSFGDSNKAGESFETEANVITGYDGRDQDGRDGANTLDEHNFLPPSRGNDYKNEFLTTAHASALADFETEDKTKNRAVIKNDAANQSEQQAQFRQEAQYGAESQADTVIQETSKNLPPPQEIVQIPYEISPLARPSVNSGDVKNTLKANPIIGASSKPLNKPGQETGSWYTRLPNKVPLSNPSITYTEPVHKLIPFYQVSKTGIKNYKPKGYEASRIPKLVFYQKGNPTKSLVTNDVADTKNNNWNPYTKPTEGETLVQAIEDVQSRAETVPDLAAQENGNQNLNMVQYQKENPNIPLVPINVLQSSYNNNKNWNPYTKPAEGETLVQAKGKIQENGNQSPDLIQYQKENHNIPLVPNNVFQNGYNSNKNWSPYTKPTEGETLVQAEEEIQNNEKAEANLAAQENGHQNPNLLQYQKENTNKPLVPINVFKNGYNNNNWNPYTKPAEGETLVQMEKEIQNNGKAETNLATQENRNQNPNMLQYQKENSNIPLVPINVLQSGYNNNWNPYTKPAEGETLVQAKEKIQENGDQSPDLIQYQKENQNIQLVPNNVFQNGYNSNNNWSPYTKPTEGETLVQVKEEIQSKEKAEANLAAQENGNQNPYLLQYQKDNTNKPLVPINVFKNGYNNNNWNPYTKPTEGETLVQMGEEIQNNGIAEANLAVQENGNRDIESFNSYNNNKNWNPYTKPTEGETLVQMEKDIQNNGKTEANIAAQENDNRNIKSFNSYNNNKNWNPYTKPTEGETLVQMEKDIQNNGKTEANIAAQENDNRNIKSFNGYNNNKNWNPYTKPTEGETLVQMEEDIHNNGKAAANIATPENGNRDIESFNGYNNNKNWNPYTKPAEGETLIQTEEEIHSSQLNSGMQYKPSTQANIVAQSNGGFHYSEEIKIPSAAEVPAEGPTNIASSYSGGLATIQMNGAQESGSSIYGNTNKYNNVYSNGQGNANSHLQNGAQFGAVKGVEPPGQVYPVIDARFGQTTHPVYRPLSAFGYNYRNGWNHW